MISSLPVGREINLFRHEAEKLFNGPIAPGKYDVHSGYRYNSLDNTHHGQVVFDVYQINVLDTNYTEHGNGD